MLPLMFTIIGTDLKNAFTQRSRFDMATAFYSHPDLAPLFPFFNMLMNTKAWMQVTTPNGIVSIPSFQGGRQGNLLICLAFALSNQPILEECTKGLACEAVAIIDDTYFVGSDNDTLAAFTRLHEFCIRNPKSGLVLVPKKCNALYINNNNPSHTPDWWITTLVQQYGFRQENVTRSSMELIGTMVATDDTELESFCKNYIDNVIEELHKLEKSTTLSIQVRMELLRTSFAQKPLYLANTLPPHITEPHLQRFDEAVLEATASLLAIAASDLAPLQHPHDSITTPSTSASPSIPTSPYLSENSLAPRANLHISTAAALNNFASLTEIQLQQPVRNGGFGLKPISPIAKYAYTAAINASIKLGNKQVELEEGRNQGKGIKYVTRRLNNRMLNIIETITNDPHIPKKVAYIKGKYLSVTDSDDQDDDSKTWNMHPANPQDWKNWLKDIPNKPSFFTVAQQTRDNMIHANTLRFIASMHLSEPKFTTRSMNRLKSLLLPGAMTWYLASPNADNQGLYLADHLYQCQAHLILGIKPPFQHLRSPAGLRCSCNFNLSGLDADSVHYLCCNFSAARAGLLEQRHDKLKMALIQGAREAGCTCIAEPAAPLNTPRADILTFMAPSRIGHTETPILLDVSVNVPSHNTVNPNNINPLQSMRNVERAKVRKHAPWAEYYFAKFTPFVINAYGALSSTAINFIHSLCTSMSEQGLDARSHSLRMKQHLAVELARGNGLCIIQGLRWAKDIN